jgi:hypothetical protein
LTGDEGFVMARNNGMVMITAEGFDACLGACQGLALFAVVGDTPPEAVSVTYQVVEAAPEPVGESRAEDSDGGTP